MATVAQSAAQFLRGTWVAILAGVSAIADPLEFGKLIGLVDRSAEWTLGANLMRAFFMLIAFGWLFWWYHQKREQYELGNPEPTIPLYLACRWIARDSQWAARFPARRDDDWVTEVDDAVMSRLRMGKLHLFGKRRRTHGPREPMQYVTPADLELLQWDSHKLASSEPPTHGWTRNGVVYYDLHLDARQLRRNWPKRSLWARLRGRSPVERIGYSSIFDEQDAYYRKFRGDGGTPLDAILAG